MPDINELATINAIRNGDYEQYEVLVERYYRGLIQHLYNLSHDGPLAEDIAQEAFMRAYDKLESYNPDYAFSTWLYKIADNLLFRRLKQRRPTTDIDEISELIPDDGPSVPEQTEREFTRESVRAAVKSLPSHYQQVVVLYYWEEHSYEQIAAVMERPVNTIRTWLYRAKAELRKELYEQV